MNFLILGTDPRCLSTKRLTPPEPLPHVSRRKLKLVRDRLEIPKVCHYCKGNVKLVNNSAIYNGRSFGKWPYAYLCESCGAYVGLHPDTDLPLGTLADEFTRSARKAAKYPFGTILRAKFKNDRNKAYDWLAEKANIERRACHFAMMDEDLAAKVFEICYNEVFEI